MESENPGDSAAEAMKEWLRQSIRNSIRNLPSQTTQEIRREKQNWKYFLVAGKTLSRQL